MQPSGDLFAEAQIHQDNDNFEEYCDDSESYENFEEQQHLVILWRFDQGGSSKIYDLSENCNNAKLLKDTVILSSKDACYIWDQGQLKAGDPLHFEDEWGKEAPPNWALHFTGSESLRVRGSKSLSKISCHFSFQVWLNPEETEEYKSNQINITLFKRQAEDFNLKMISSSKLEISRAQNVRNKVEMNLSKEIKANEWSNLTVTYRQPQINDSEEDLGTGLKVYLNGEVVFQDPKVNLRKPLKETDGLIFLENYTGRFTEIRFWSTNLSQPIIHETYNKPLDCVDELRKRIKMDDDEFLAASKAKAKKGKRGTLVAPPGKGLGLKNALRRPARGSLKITSNDQPNVKLDVDNQIQEETYQESRISDNQSEESDLSPKGKSELNKSNSRFEEEKDAGKRGEQIDILKQEPSAKDDDFNFDFDVRQKSKETKDAWSEEQFNTNKPPKAKQPDFNEFDWNTSNPKKKAVIEESFDWGSADQQKKVEEKTGDDKQLQQKNDNEEENLEQETLKHNQNQSEVDEGEHHLQDEKITIHHNQDTASIGQKIEKEDQEIEKEDQEQQNSEHHSRKSEAEKAEGLIEEDLSVNQEEKDNEHDKDETIQDVDLEEAQDDQAENEGKAKDLQKSQTTESKEKEDMDYDFSTTALKQKKSKNESKEIDDFNFNTPQDKNKPSDEFEFNFSKEKESSSKTKAVDDHKDDFDFDFGVKASSKGKASQENKTDDFDFDFGSTTTLQASENHNKGFDEFEDNSKTKRLQKDHVAFDDFFENPKGVSKQGLPDRTNSADTLKASTDEAKEEENKRVGAEDEPANKDKRERKESVQITSQENLPPDDSEAPDNFLAICIDSIERDIIAKDYDSALITIESNMNELIYDFKELQRSHAIKTEKGDQQLTEQELDDYDKEQKTLKANIRFLNFYKLSMKVCLQVQFYNIPENKDSEMAASLANILVLPPVHEPIKKKFYHIAIEENMKFHCYKVALKLIKSFGKQLKNLTDQELEEMDQIKKRCEANMEHNRAAFECAN